MRFSCGQSYGQKRLAAQARRRAYVETLTQWHRVFIWWPTRFGASNTSPGTCVWLEYVWRRVDLTGLSLCIDDWVRVCGGQFYPLEIGDVEWRLTGEEERPL